MSRPCSIVVYVIGTILALCPASTFAQGGTTKSALSGVVLDSGAAVIPGATVDVTHIRTGVATTTVTNASGAFSLPSLDAGVYTVRVSLAGFRTVVLQDVELLAAVPRAVRVTLDVGGVEEAVEVHGGSQLVQTQATSVSATIRADQIQTLPLVSRNTLNFVVFSPGVDTSTGNHSQRSSTIAGLPQNAISLTVDGANVQDKYARSTDGFQANVMPRLDAIEEVTVTTATPGADASGAGAVQIRFVTRSGSNDFSGSAYEYLRDDRFNSNYYFNAVNGLPKNKINLNQYGVREGGPIVIPGLFDGHNRAFFFFNFEQLRFPLNNTRTREVLNPQAQQGAFRYGSTSVNLFDVAAHSGQTSSPDPTITAVLAKIRAATSTTGTFVDRTDPNVQDYLWQPTSLRYDNVPTTRIDFNLSKNERLTGTYQYQGQRLHPNLFGGTEARFPGFANRADLYSAASRGSSTLRSTVGANRVNELRWGFSNAPVYSSDTVTLDQFNDQGGSSLAFPTIGGVTLTGATTTAALSSRNGKSWNIDDTYNWLKGRHAVQIGGSFSRTSGWTFAQTLVPTLSFGVDASDPATAMFTTANFPGASAADLTNARNLYALLTGRVTQITSSVRLNVATGQYEYLGPGRTEERQDELGLFAQDSWRLTSRLTVNAGVRWQLARPFTANLSSYTKNTLADACGVSGLGNDPGGNCNLFNPGVFNSGGRVPVYEQYAAGTPAYKTDYNNIAPNVGVAWQPHIEHGLLRAVLGDPESATVRGSYGVAYNSDGLSFYTNVFGSNPGGTINTTRSSASAQFPLVGPGETWPVLLRDPSRLGPSPNIPAAPQYPLAANFSSGVNLFLPSYQTPFSRSYSFGVQRTFGKLSALEVRYVGTRLIDGAATENWNEVNFTSNGFLDEFRHAQQNLQASVAAGCGGAGAPACSFAYRGPGTGTVPLPLYLAAFSGIGTASAGDPSRYNSSNWTDTTRLSELALMNPNPSAAATALFTTAAFRTSLVAAGYPANLFVLNPDVQTVNVVTNGGFTKYDSIQVLFRRALSHGLAVDVNYTGARRLTATLDTLRQPRRLVTSTDGVPHAVKLTASYELPFGHDRTFLADANGFMQALVGGWALNLAGRVQSGTIVNFGNVRLAGMTADDLQQAFRIRIDPATHIVYTLPQDIIDNTIKAFSVSATSPTGYGALGAPSGRYLAPANGPDCIQVARGDCAPHDVFVHGPAFTRFDLNAKKRFSLGGKRTLEAGADVFNLFNAINFVPIAQAGSGATIDQVTQAYQDPNVTFDPGGRLVQLVFRISW